MSNENKIVGTICLIFFIIIGLLFWKGPSSGGPSQVKNPDMLVRDNSHMTGRRDAKVTMVEFGDYQCPACAVISVEIKKVKEAYKDNPDFNFVFRNFPLPQHKNAIVAAESAESAGAQGKYFEMEELLYANQAEWAESTNPTSIFVRYAESLGLDMTKFNSDMSEHKFTDVIQSDTIDGIGLSVDHTPTVYINGLEQKDLSFEGIKARIDELLAQ